MNPIKKECYALLQQIVKKRDILCYGPACESLVTSGHHMYSRSDMATCFDPRYTISLCVDCHSWAHKKPAQFREWIISWMGEDEYYFGLRKSNSTVKNQNYIEIREGLKRILVAYKKA